MAELTPLDEKLGEVLGLAQAAQDATTKVAGEAKEMMQTYLAEEEEALDGFEFLSMAEAGELAHWEIVKTMSETVGEQQVTELADWAVGVQRKHFETVRETSLELAA